MTSSAADPARPEPGRAAAAAAPAPIAGRQLPALDGLRGLAIALVLACHFGNAWPGEGPLDAALRGATGLGFTGVDLFFVLSGFLITGILVDTVGKPGWWTAFLARRALRIFPLYYLALAVFAVAGPAAGLVDGWTLRARGWWYLAYLGNWAYPARQGIPALSHLWSLAVEEQFYLVWPLVVLAARGRRLAAVSVALVLAAPGLRAAIVAAGWPVGSAYRVTPGRVDALALGALLAVMVRAAAGRAALRRGWAAAAVAGLCGFLALGAAHRFDMHDPVMEIASHSLLALGFGGLVAGAAVTDADPAAWLQRVLRARGLRALGRISYGLYVIHFFVHEAALAALRARPAGAALLGTRAGYAAYALAGAAASVLLARASFHLFERPFLRLKERFTVGRGGRFTRGAAAAPAARRDAA